VIVVANRTIISPSGMYFITKNIQDFQLIASFSNLLFYFSQTSRILIKTKIKMPHKRSQRNFEWCRKYSNYITSYWL